MNASSIETNWTCKLDRGFTPFFHVFNGPMSREAEFDIHIVVKDSSQVVEKTFGAGIQHSFQSKIFYLDEIFGDELRDLENPCIEVKIPSDQVFPRMVVGNFHRPSEFLEVTHSFPKIEEKDFVSTQGSAENDLLSFMIAPQPSSLNLQLVSFPTNSSSLVSANISTTESEENSLEITEQTSTWQTGPSGEIMFYSPEKDGMSCFEFRKGEIPSRLNANYRFSVRGSEELFSTDIATGAKSNAYPPKKTHWGHGVVSSDYETLILVRNLAHKEDDNRRNFCNLSIYSENGNVVEHQFHVNSKSYRFIKLKELVEYNHGTRIVSWIMNCEFSNLETFWISYTDDGRICGEHGF